MTSTTIIVIVLIVSGILLLRFASKFIFKLMGLLLFAPAILIILYLFNIGPFSTNLFSRDNLSKKFCISEQTLDVCECVVKKYKTLVESKFTEEELNEIENKNYESAYVFKQLTDQLAIQTAICSGSEDSAKILMDKFMTGLIPFGLSPSKGLDWISEKTGEMKEKNERKEELDSLLKI